MLLFDIILIALALAIDAFVVSFSYGLIIKKKRNLSALKLALSTGGGQFIMPLIGWYGTKAIYKYVATFDHWIAFFVFLFLGIKVIADALENKNSDNPKKLDKNLSFKILLIIGIATSIDAFVMGGTLFFVKINILLAASLIGIITFISSIAAFRLARAFRKLPTKYMEISAGLILIALGIKVLCEHLSA